jgi:hypothetical protein
MVIAFAAAWAPVPATIVETWFSRGWYPVVQRIVTPLSNTVPFALLDVLALGAAAAITAGLWRVLVTARRTRRLGPVLTFVMNLGTASAIVYLLFLGLWGLNYRRMPISQRLMQAGDRPDANAVVNLGLESARQVNALRTQAHATGWQPDEWRNEPLRTALASTQAALGDRVAAHPGRVKWTMFGPYFRWTSVDGMVDPFALEALANPDLLPWERPFVAAHEWAHLAGYAHEAEANFVGWLICMQADAPARYSGWLFLYWQILGEVESTDRERMAAALDPGPREDIDAIVARLRRGQFPLMRRIGWRVYDQYLRANRVEGGVRSYSEVVTLILQTRFEEGWVPRRR